MKKISEPIVFFGNERLATGVTTSAPTLSALIARGYTVVAVVTNYNEAITRKSRELEVKTIAEKNNIPVLLPETLIAIKDQLKDFNAIAGILAAYGKMVPQEIIDLFPLGIINIHPSLLPKHRGPTPIESVILNGSTETGVSLMKLVKSMDAGPVYAQTNLDLNGNESKQELADVLGKIGADLLIKHLPSILSKINKGKDQLETEATYDRLITKLDGAIDWNMRAEAIVRQIRAYKGWPGSRSELLGKDALILEAEIINKTGVPGEVLVQDKQLVVCSGEQAVNILKLKPAGKQEMTGQAFLAGYGKHLRP